MRTIEARNLRWRDVDVRIDKQGRQFCCLNVRGKNKYLVSALATQLSWSHAEL